MSDPTELARLTGIPDIREIWVLGNPFVKSHAGYRITIFNLFRQTPGYTEDIFIDTYGPGYSERRSLVDRAPEKPNVPVVKPQPHDYGVASIDVSKPIIEYPSATDASYQRRERPVPSPSTSEINTSSGSQRKRRTPKRRIVDLSTIEVSPSKNAQQANPTVRFSSEEVITTTGGSDSGYGISPDPSPKTLPHYVPTITRDLRDKLDNSSLDTSGIPRLVPLDASPFDAPTVKSPVDTTSQEDWKSSGETYKKKLEALKSEQGEGWLSALNEEGWDAQRPQDPKLVSYSPASTIRPELAGPKPSSQQSISSRTLG